MTARTVNAASFTLTCLAGGSVNARVHLDPVTQVATLVPTAELPAHTACTATLDSSIEDGTGLTLVADYQWQFVTGSAPQADTVRPRIVATLPQNGASGMPTNTRVSLLFSEPMQAATITNATFTLTDTTLGRAVDGTVVYASASRTASFTPAGTAPLQPGHVYRASLGQAATDLAGNGLSGNTAAFGEAGAQVWSFSSGDAADTQAPVVLAVSPIEGGTADCPSRQVSATFGESLDGSTITAFTLAVTAGGTAVPGTVGYDATRHVLTFTAAKPSGLAAHTVHTATLLGGASGVRDQAGLPLPDSKTWSFDTGQQTCLRII
jgi:hypothetical protein